MKIEMENMGGKSQNEILGMENTIVQFIISLDGINRLETTEEKTRELEDIATETIQNETQREKWLKNNTQSLSDLQENIKWFNISAIGIPGEKKEGTQKYLKK